MTAIAFDTLKFAKRLKEAGFTEQQAEALAAAEAEFVEENLATKRDMKELEVSLKQDIAEVKRDMKELEVSLKHDIAEVKRDMKELDVSLKRDMKELEVALKRDIKELETNLARGMKDLEYRMTIKLGAMLVLAVGAMATLVKIL
ncbi:MAG: CCDC90 family protein [Methylococcaceae bacterium]|nr:CCDC90 family protein [Methylococcaceae bacterium]